MMPDLGKYAEAVLSSYAVTIALIAVLIVLSVRRSNRVKKELQEVETKVKSNG
ncbi:Heme exporter protein D (CcmD) [Roseovarius sp. TM1035]|jgi:heme exporter protein D|uniref:Heme exporter protein D n=1 Tax=Roseovarius mucosus TaxID=215743 RepID=A0A1V0RKK1_9RHOB|nr:MULTISPECIES: heme exporter protein CcmD [Roseovarius]ARE82290.1 heme exporter protein D (CcmD) [Roseovarius mucosus]EDM30651.1 Heme exporter protein D (CcmD) [Roseovarius sp. TM1035]MBW4972613.1 heme exporter protein CcmD [Roseovarius mucosus]